MINSDFFIYLLFVKIVSTAASDPEVNESLCASFPDDVSGARVENVSRSEDVLSVTYTCNESFMWHGGSSVRQCHLADGTWTGTPMQCVYDG